MRKENKRFVDGYESLVLIAVVLPPADPRVPVVSKLFIGLAPPSRTLMNRVLDESYFVVKASDTSSAKVSM